MITSSRSAFVQKGAAIFGALAALLIFSDTATAQSFNYSDTSFNTAVPDNGCATPTQAIFNVPDSFIIDDLNVGIVLDTPYRGAYTYTITSPAGTTVTLVNQVGAGANDLNVRFDSASGTTIGGTGHDNSNPYPEFTRAPQGSLDAFNGETSTGNWTIEGCDNDGFNDNGFWEEWYLEFTAAQNFIDLELDVSANTTVPPFGANVTLTLTLDNLGDISATGVDVDYLLPGGLSFVSASGDGTYNDTTGVWDAGSIAASGTASIDIIAEVMSTGSHSSFGEVSAANEGDNDSTPNNSGTNPGEDDTDTLTITPAYGGGTGPSGEPNLSCAVSERFDWDTNAWPAGGGSLTQNYPTGGSDNTSFSFAFTGDTGQRGNNAPETNTDMQGGLTPAQQSLYYWQNLSATTQSVDLTIDIGTPGTGVQDLQFTVFDLDFFAGQFRDRLTVQGFLNGSPVTPVLTPGSANAQVGSVVLGTDSNDNAQAGGNIIITFLSPVDQVVLNYGNTEASAGTSNQAMSVHDLNYCPRETDFGDIAATYGNASHLVQSGYQIGATAPDGETSTQTSANADGDDVANADDEDTLDFSGLVSGQSSNLLVNVTGSGGFLQMWIDWNGNGVFTDTVDGVQEQIATDVTIAGTAGTATIPVTVPASATLSQTFARLRWSSQSGLGPGGAAPDGEVEDHALTIIGAPSLNGNKTMQIYDPSSAGLYAIPGNDVIYTITVSNSGFGPTDANTIELIDAMPSEVEFFNGDIDTGGPDTFPGTDPVGFTQANGAAMTLNYAANVAFSNSASQPADFASCTYTPLAGYDPNVTFICINPQGALGAGNPDPEFSVSFRARIQ